MKRPYLSKPFAFLVALVPALAACSHPPIRPQISQREASPAGIETFGSLVFHELAPGVWQHTSSFDLPGAPGFPSNGLIVVDGPASLLVDTAWTVEQTEVLLTWANNRLRKPIRAALVTHAHVDKMGGIEALHAANIPTYAHSLSNGIAPGKGLNPAKNSLEWDAFGWATGEAAALLAPLAIFYPGAGHTVDNITVGVQSSPVAFGGCLLKGSTSRSLGNLADADTAHYALAVQNFADAFPDATILAMSHSPAEGRGAIAHTIELARDL